MVLEYLHIPLSSVVPHWPSQPSFLDRLGDNLSASSFPTLWNPVSIPADSSDNSPLVSSFPTTPYCVHSGGPCSLTWFIRPHRDRLLFASPASFHTSALQPSLILCSFPLGLYAWLSLDGEHFPSHSQIHLSSSYWFNDLSNLIFQFKYRSFHRSSLPSLVMWGSDTWHPCPYIIIALITLSSFLILYKL